MECILEKKSSSRHKCTVCGIDFECKSYNVAAGLCKCEQQISVCECDICKPQKIGLSFYCSEECEQNAIDQDESDDEDFYLY